MGGNGQLLQDQEAAAAIALAWSIGSVGSGAATHDDPALRTVVRVGGRWPTGVYVTAHVVKHEVVIHSLDMTLTLPDARGYHRVVVPLEQITEARVDMGAVGQLVTPHAIHAVPAGVAQAVADYLLSKASLR